MYSICYTFDHIIYNFLNTVSDEFIKEFEKNRSEIDKFIYTLNVYRTVLDCGEKYLSLELMCEPERNYWRDIELQQNFINAVACYKSNLSLYDGTKSAKGPVSQIGEDSYNSPSWFRFIYEYRNVFYHQNMFARDHASNWNTYLDLDEVFEKIRNGKKKKDPVIDKLKEYINESAEVVDHHIAMKDIVRHVLDELNNIHYDMVRTACDRYIYHSLGQLSSSLYRNADNDCADTCICNGTTVIAEINQPIEILWVTCHILDYTDISVGLIGHSILHVNNYRKFVTKDLLKYNALMPTWILGVGEEV